MNRVESDTLASQGLCYEVILPDNAVLEIERKLQRERMGPIVRWEGRNDQGELLVQSMEYAKGQTPEQSKPVKFFFMVGTQITEYENIYFNPDHSEILHLKAQDVADLFLISQKALVDGVSPRNVKAAFEETFKSHHSDDTAVTKKAQLARELVNRKYLS